MDGPTGSKAPTADYQLMRILGDDNLRDLVFQHLPIRDTLTFARTCRAHHKLMMDSRFDINAKLKRFNLDAITFRTALGRAGALITGSLALQFLLGSVWKDTDLDVMVEMGANMEILDRFLVEEEGFAMASTQHAAWSGCGGEQCRTYTKTSDDYGTTRIHLIGCTSLPIQAILSGHYTSCIVNFISWNKAYSIFPRTTFVDRQTVPLAPQNNFHFDLLEKYAARGFTPREVVPRDVRGWGDARHRFVGDKHTWTLRLDTTGITPPKYPDFVLESCAFNMHYEAKYGGGDDDGDVVAHDDIADIHFVGSGLNGSLCYDDYMDWCGPWSHVRISARSYTHPSLRYTYTDSDATFFDRAFVDELEGMHASRRMCKVRDEAQQGASGPNNGAACFIARAHLLKYVKSERPKGWVYLDDLVMKKKKRIAQYGHSTSSQFELLGPSSRRQDT